MDVVGRRAGEERRGGWRCARKTRTPYLGYGEKQMFPKNCICFLGFLFQNFRYALFIPNILSVGFLFFLHTSSTSSHPPSFLLHQLHLHLHLQILYMYIYTYIYYIYYINLLQLSTTSTTSTTFTSTSPAVFPSPREGQQ